MKAIFINGSPRKNKNTAQMLEPAVDEPTRAHIRETRFPQDLQKAYELGKRLVEKANAQ